MSERDWWAIGLPRLIGHSTMAEACDLAEHHTRAALAGQRPRRLA